MDEADAQALEARLLDVLSTGPQSISNLAGQGLGKEYNAVFHKGVKKNNGSFKSWLSSVNGVEVVQDEAWGGRYCVKLMGQDHCEKPPDGNSSTSRRAKRARTPRPALSALVDGQATAANPKLHLSGRPAPRPSSAYALARPTCSADRSVQGRTAAKIVAHRGALSQRSRSPLGASRLRPSTPRSQRFPSMRAAPQKAGLRPGWEMHWDSTYEMHYYWNPKTNESRWTPP